MKRSIQFIVVHCTATQPEATIKAIQGYWRDVQKWKDPGYHYIIQRSGEIVQLQDEDKVANGVAGHNQHAIHLSYIGGVDKAGHPADNRTDAQKEAMMNKLIELSERYPQAKILGHRDFPGVHKACPSFDVRKWLSDYEPDLKNAA